MILVDSSAWIEYYRPQGLYMARQAVAEAVRDDKVAGHGIVRVEIVAFARNEKERRRLASDFAAFHELGPLEQDFDRAISLGYQLRREGFTVPTTDLIIAASAIRADCILYHLDAHFEQIASLSELRCRNLGTDSSYMMEPPAEYPSH